MLTRAIEQDEFMAISYFQKGICLFKLRDFESSLRNFEIALSLINDNESIDYEQLGLDYKLYKEQVVFNMSKCYKKLENPKKAERYLKNSLKTENDDIHDFITRNKTNSALFSCDGLIFEIPERKAKNLEAKDFLQEAIVVGSGDVEEICGGFSGALILDGDAKTLRRHENNGDLLKRKKSIVSDTSGTLTNSTLNNRRKQQQQSLNRYNKSEYGSSNSQSTTLTSIASVKSAGERHMESLDREHKYNRSKSMPRTRVQPLETLNVQNTPLKKLKIHTNYKTTTLTTRPNINLSQLQKMVEEKLRLKQVELMYIDEDVPEVMASIYDDEDLSLAMEGQVVHLYIRE